MLRPGFISRHGGAAAPGGFSPSDIAGLWMWLDADAITGLADGDPVATWEDAHTSNRDATQATSAARPTYKTNIVNGKPIVRFDHTDDHMLLPDISGLTAGTLFAVLKANADPAAVATGAWHLGSAGGNGSHYPHTDGNLYEAFGTNTRPPGIDPGLSLAAWRYYTVRAVSGSWEHWLDGSSLQSRASNTVAFPSAPLLGKADPTFVNWVFGGDMAEVLIYDSGLLTSDRQDVEGYLATKWGL